MKRIKASQLEREHARRLYQDDEIQIDDDAFVSRTGRGRSCWVQAWVYVADDDFNAEPERRPV